MRMIPMPRVNEYKTQISEAKKDSNIEPVETKSFQSEFDTKLENVNKVENSSKNENTTKEDNTDKVDSKPLDNVKDNTKSEDVERSSDEKIDADNNVVSENKDTKKIVKKNLNNTEIKDLKISESFIEKLNSSDSDKSKKNKLVKDNKKSIKNLDVISDKNKKVKDTDKDTLNQSIAASQNMQVEVEEKSDIKLKEDNNISDEKISSLSDNSKVEKKVENVQNASFNVVKNKSSKSESKNDKNSKSDKTENKFKVNDVRAESKKSVALDNKVNKVDNNESIDTLNVDGVETGELESGVDDTLTLGSTEITAEGDSGKSQAPVMKEAVSLIKQQLKDFGNNEIVKQSRFILKDNNVGEIKLILKPESLGQVKINLNLNENSLAGQIVVENNSVKEIFQENLGQLSKSLQEQGYDSAKLDISLSDKGEQEFQDQKKKNKQYFSDRLKRIDESGQVVRYGAPTAGINLTA